MLYTSTNCYSVCPHQRPSPLHSPSIIVFYKPYESQGQAWPLTYVRLVWGVLIFLVFMTGFFLLSKSFVLSSLLVPLLAGTVIWSWWLHKSLTPLSDYVNLSSVFEVERGEESADVARLKLGHPVTWSQRLEYTLSHNPRYLVYLLHTVI